MPSRFKPVTIPSKGQSTTIMPIHILW